MSVRIAVDRPVPADALAKPQGRLTVTLLHSFRLECDDEPVDLPLGAQRLVAFLALHGHPLLRLFVAGTLWLDSSDERAAASLRSSLWRLNQPGLKVVDGSNGRLALAPGVEVDLRTSTTLAHALLDGDVGTSSARRDTAALSGDVLPDWYDDWLVMERERFRQLRLHALEALAERLLARGEFAQAVETAQEAAIAEPLRESVHRLLVRIHLAEGNQCEAVRQFALCKRMFHDELGVGPSPRMAELVAHLTA